MVNRILSPSRIVGAVIVVLFMGLSFASSSMPSRLELLLYDTFSRLSPSTVKPSGKTALIEIHGQSPYLENYGHPYRKQIAELIPQLDEAGADLIGLMVPLTQRSGGAGYEAVLDLRQKLAAHPLGTQEHGLASWVRENLERLEHELDLDAMLTRSVLQSQKVLLPVFVDFEGKGDDNSSHALEDISESLLGPNNLDEAVKQRITAAGIILPFSELRLAAAGFGHAKLTLDNKFEGRQHAIFVRYRGALIPSMPLRLATAHKGLDPAEIHFRNGRLRLGTNLIHTVQGGVLPRFSGNDLPFPVYSSADILEGKAGNAIKDRIVVVALGPEAGAPYYNTPIDKLMPEGRLAAWILEDILTGRHVARPRALHYLEPIMVLLAGLVALFLFSRYSYTGSAIATAGLVASLLAAGYSSLSWGSIWIQVGSASVCMVLVYLAATLERIYLMPSTGKTSEGADGILRLSESDTPSDFDRAESDEGVPADAEDRPRSKVGRYEILGEVGRGAMGLVYKARDPKINRLLAIKAIRFSDEFEDEVIQEIKDRFFAEAEIAGKLSHPSIVTIYDVGDDGDLTYMAMELLEGKDLDNFTTKENLLPLPGVLDVVARTAEALAFAHRANVIHRDIKPANIMLLESGGVKVTDFGIAKAISSSRTRTGVILGTPNYMSPEQIMGQKIDHRSDIFSLGVLFFQLLTGRLPFQGENLSKLLYQITQARHPSAREISPRIPKACEQIIDKALAKNPAERFQEASEMLRVLELLRGKIQQLLKSKHQRLH